MTKPAKSFRRGLGAVWVAAAIVLPARAVLAGELATPSEVVVFAAASLKESFEAIAKEFETAHPGTHVVLQLAGSQELRMQIENGANADVFASADLRHMAALREAKLVEEPAIFAKNEPVVIVPRTNPQGLSSFADLRKAKTLIVGVEEVPIGRYTSQILAKAALDLGDDFAKRVEANIASRELNVRQILAKVSLGEGDAGFVYRTDATAAGDKVRVIEIPVALNVIAEYPIAATTRAPHPDLARAWVAVVLSQTGQKALSRAGFLAGR